VVTAGPAAARVGPRWLAIEIAPAGLQPPCPPAWTSRARGVVSLQ
jgi:hypothetical protein